MVEHRQPGSPGTGHGDSSGCCTEPIQHGTRAILCWEYAICVRYGEHEFGHIKHIITNTFKIMCQGHDVMVGVASIPFYTSTTYVIYLNI